MVSVAPQAERKRPVDFWMFGEGVWRLGLDSEGLRREFANGLNFG